MTAEIIIEEGVVVSIGKGTADVAVRHTESCGECSAKIICKPKSGDENIIKVEDPFGVKPGDIVRIEINGYVLLKASFLLYGVPLILLLTGIFSGMSLFSNYSAKELYSFLWGIGLVALYYFLGSFNKAIEKRKHAKIVAINR